MIHISPELLQELEKAAELVTNEVPKVPVIFDHRELVVVAAGSSAHEELAAGPPDRMMQIPFQWAGKNYIAFS